MDADLASRAVLATLSEKPFRAGALLVMEKGFLARALLGNRLNIACKRVRARILHEDAEFWVRDLGSRSYGIEDHHMRRTRASIR